MSTQLLSKCNRLSCSDIAGRNVSAHSVTMAESGVYPGTAAIQWRLGNAIPIARGLRATACSRDYGNGNSKPAALVPAA